MRSNAIDAYAAILATDKTSALEGIGDKTMAPARFAILDVANKDGDNVDEKGNVIGDGEFTEHDLYRFLSEFKLRNASLNALRLTPYDLLNSISVGNLSPA